MIGVFLDSETSGLNPHKHSILELAYKILDMQTGATRFSYEAMIAIPRALWENSDPQSLEVNGLTWDEVSSGLPINTVKGNTVTAFAQNGVRRGEAVFICQNPSFDRAFFSQVVDPDLQEALEWPYHWLDLASMYWGKHVTKKPHPWDTGVSKDKISEVYHLPPEKTPHRAMNGVNHLISCYEAVVGFPAKTEITL